MPTASPLAQARDGALDVLRSLGVDQPAVLALLSSRLVANSDSRVPISAAAEAVGGAAALRVVATPDCPGIVRAGYVAAAAALGIGRVVLFGEGRPVREPISPADLFAVEDHINLLGASPLIGRYDPSLGPRFPDMSAPYARRWLDAVRTRGDFPGCTYAAIQQVAFDAIGTRERLRLLGADFAGPWIVPELLAARGDRLGNALEVLAFVRPIGAHYGATGRDTDAPDTTWDRYKYSVVAAAPDV